MKNKWLWSVSVVLLVGIIVLILGQYDNKSLGVGDKLNADGIREDVAVAIAKKFPQSEKKRAAATQFARSLQKAIDHPDEALSIVSEFEKAAECLNAIEIPKPEDPMTDTGDFLEASVVNSLARTRAYIRYNGNLSGQILGEIEQSVTYCEFDPSKMKD